MWGLPSGPATHWEESLQLKKPLHTHEVHEVAENGPLRIVHRLSPFIVCMMHKSISIILIDARRAVDVLNHCLATAMGWT